MVAAAQTSHLPPLQRVKAYDALCSFLEHDLKSTAPGAKSALNLERVCQALLDLYLTRNDSLKAKHSKRLLSTILLLTTDDAIVSTQRDPLDALTNTLCDIIFCNDDLLRARPAFQALSFFLSKKKLSWGSLCGHVCSPNDSEPLQNEAQGVIYRVLPWINRQDTAQPASNFITAFVDDVGLDAVEVMAKPAPCGDQLVQYLLCHEDQLVSFKNYLFPSLFAKERKYYGIFVRYLETQISQIRDDRQKEPLERVLLTGLQVGIELGMAIVPDTAGSNTSRPAQRQLLTSCDNPTENPILINLWAIQDQVLTRCSNEARVAGLSLITSSQQRTRPLSSQAIKCLKRHLPQLFVDHDAGFRSEVLGLIQNLLDRLRSVIASKSNRQALEAGSSSRRDRIFEDHTGFLLWFHKFLVKSLHPSAPYQKQITSLRAMLMLLKSGIDGRTKQSPRVSSNLQWPICLSIFTPTLRFNLQQLLLNAYDDVRQFAWTLLQIADAHGTSLTFDDAVTRSDHTEPHTQKHKSLLANSPSGASLERLVEGSKRMMLESGRADHSDGAARAFALLIAKTRGVESENSDPSADSHGFYAACRLCHDVVELLEESLRVAENDLPLAVVKYPIHGHFMSLR